MDTELPKPWLGVRTQVVTTDVARALGLAKAGGHRITQVYEGTEAAKAGLQPGDIIVSINAQAVRATRMQDSEELKRMVESLALGETAKLGLLRAGKPVAVAVKLEATPKSAARANTARQEALEFSVREIMPMDRMESRRFKDIKGLLVSDVTQGGWAAMAGLSPDDVVLSINGTATPDIPAFEEAMARVMKAHPRTVTLFVQRDYRTHFVFIEPDWSRMSSGAK